MGSSSLTRDRTGAPCIGSMVLATGPPRKSPLLVIYSKEIKTHVPPPTKKTHTHIQSTIIHKAKNWKQLKCPPTGRGKDKQIVVYSYNGKLLSKRMDQASEKQSKVDESLKQYTEQKKQDKWVYIIWLHLHKVLKQAKLEHDDRSQIRGYLEQHLERDWQLQKNTRDFLKWLKCPLYWL